MSLRGKEDQSSLRDEETRKNLGNDKVSNQGDRSHSGFSRSSDG
jgi:hypothetical protein